MGQAWNAGFFSKMQKTHTIRKLHKKACLGGHCFDTQQSPEIVGSNQIKTIFDPEYERVLNLEGYDRISKYYLRPDDHDTDEEDENID